MTVALLHASESAAAALRTADIVLCTERNPPFPVLAALPENVEFIDAEELTQHGAAVFYDLAAREGFRIVHICSAHPAERDRVFEYRALGRELGLATESVAEPSLDRWSIARQGRA